MLWEMTIFKEPRSLFATVEGDGCMNGTHHHIRHPRGHPGDRASYQRARGCAWHDDQFGRGQNTVLGWSDPTLAHGSVPKVILRVAPARCWFVVRAFFGKCETASLFAPEVLRQAARESSAGQIV